MLQALLSAMTTKPLDVQVWHCDPLLVVIDGDKVSYGFKTNVEFTPFDSPTLVGHAIALTPNAEGVCPEIAINSQQYVDGPLDGFNFSRRQGLILGGTDQFDGPVTWLINGEADRFLLSAQGESVEYDEETAKILEEELQGEPLKLNLDSRF